MLQDREHDLQKVVTCKPDLLGTCMKERDRTGVIIFSFIMRLSLQLMKAALLYSHHLSVS